VGRGCPCSPLWSLASCRQQDTSRRSYHQVQLYNNCTVVVVGWLVGHKRCKQGLNQTTQERHRNKSVRGVSAYGSRLHGTVAKINEHKEGT
jgi:hypothetical protein